MSNCPNCGSALVTDHLSPGKVKCMSGCGYIISEDTFNMVSMIRSIVRDELEIALNEREVDAK